MVKFAKVDPSTIKVTPELVVRLKPREGLVSNLTLRNFFPIWRQEILNALLKSPFLLPAKSVIAFGLCKLTSLHCLHVR